ncbi:hypothetical protein CO704_15875 [Cedecea neteri]|uniref:Uncharacterized protein n=1 Tax=Cedecea neteri TaxID=158822 RepID=A0A291E0L8_9ENTR|nr:hypothetical protein CO704_15875 [Cedecea neteri]
MWLIRTHRTLFPTCKIHASLFILQKKNLGNLHADVARFYGHARITVARVGDYSPDEKTPFINFLDIFRLFIRQKRALWQGFVWL